MGCVPRKPLQVGPRPGVYLNSGGESCSIIIFPDIPQIFPCFPHYLKPKDDVPHIVHTNHSISPLSPVIIPYCLMGKASSDVLLFRPESSRIPVFLRLKPWQENHHFFPHRQVPKETGLEGARCFHLLWAEGFGSPSSGVLLHGPDRWGWYIMQPWGNLIGGLIYLRNIIADIG